MSEIPEYFLEQLRASVHISEVAIKCGVRLARAGGEWEVIGNASLKINDKKGKWNDFASGDKGGDVFEFVMQHERCDFREAVERVANIAGVPLPVDGGGNGKNGSNEHSRAHDEARPASQTGFAATQQIVGAWDYVDENNRPLYQTVRVQWKRPDGTWKPNEKTGKPDKTFWQRRRSPEVDGTWVNSLRFVEEDGEPIEFMRKGPGANWQRYNEKNYHAWRYTERRNFADFGNVPHTLINLPTILDELREERQEQRTIFIPEGEKKVDLLTSWGCIATCNSGGAGNWHAGMAEIMRDAADIVILEDNDKGKLVNGVWKEGAGRLRTLKMAPMLLDHGCRVRVLTMPQVWPDAPEKADIVDWAERGGGTRDKLLQTVLKLPEWTPPPFESKYEAHSWGSWQSRAVRAYPWQVRGLIPAGENVLIMGPSGSGKSFETTNLALSVARGIDYNGRRVKRGGVVYCNYESSGGMENRLRAYEQYFCVPSDERIPFAWLARPPGIYASEENAAELARDIKELTKDWHVPLEVIVVDTHNAASRGSSEIKTEDVTKIMDRYAKITTETGAPLWIVGHTNDAGDHRGNQVFTNAIETTILIDRVREGAGRNAPFVRDNDNRVLRRVTVRKQRQGEEGVTWDFVLYQIELGVDDGEMVTSMVSKPPSTDEEAPRARRVPFSRDERTFWNALKTALGESGLPPPDNLKLPSSVGLVVTWDEFVRIYDSSCPPPFGDVEEKQYRASRHKAGVSLKNRRVVAFTKDPAGKHWVWITKPDAQGGN